MTRKQRLVVVGNGMAGARFVEELLSRGGGERWSIAMFGDEPHGNYNRILLSGVLAGKHDPRDIVLNPLAWYREQGIRLHAGVPAERLDLAARTVRGAGVEEIYDALVLATGSSPLVPPIEGARDAGGTLRDGVFVFRTLDDCRAITARAASARVAAVVGGGLLGLEAARGLLALGLEVHVVHLATHLMELQLDPPGARILQRSLERMGLRVHLGRSTREILGAQAATGLRFEDGGTLDADLVVIAAGIRPNVALAREAGLLVERGIAVGDDLRTDDPHVFALGECAQHRGRTYGLVAPLWEQAQVLADRLSGREPRATYAGSRVATKLKVMGIELAVMGQQTRPGAAALPGRGRDAARSPRRAGGRAGLQLQRRVEGPDPGRCARGPAHPRRGLRGHARGDGLRLLQARRGRARRGGRGRRRAAGRFLRTLVRPRRPPHEARARPRGEGAGAAERLGRVPGARRREGARAQQAGARVAPAGDLGRGVRGRAGRAVRERPRPREHPEGRDVQRRAADLRRGDLARAAAAHRRRRRAPRGPHGEDHRRAADRPARHRARGAASGLARAGRAVGPRLREGVPHLQNLCRHRLLPVRRGRLHRPRHRDRAPVPGARVAAQAEARDRRMPAELLRSDHQGPRRRRHRGRALGALRGRRGGLARPQGRPALRGRPGGGGAPAHGPLHAVLPRAGPVPGADLRLRRADRDREVRAVVVRDEEGEAARLDAEVEAAVRARRDPWEEALEPVHPSQFRGVLPVLPRDPDALLAPAAGGEVP